MGIVETELASFELETGQNVTVEYNTNGILHVHIGNIRLDFSPDEFEQFANHLAEGANELRSIKFEQ